MKKNLFSILILILLITSCNLQPFTEVEPPAQEETEIEENTLLFEDTGSEFVFESNDTKYITQNGYTIWCIKGTDPVFSSRSLTAYKESGTGEAGYGMVFLHQKIDEKDFLLTVMINTKGQYIIGKVNDGDFSVISDWKNCTYLNKGYGVNNKIEITYSEEKFILKINDKRITDFTVSEKISLNNTGYGYVTVISGTERFPENSVKIVFNK